MIRLFSFIPLIFAMKVIAVPANFTEQVDAIFKEIDTQSHPGCSVGIIEKGQVIYQKGFGLANMELDIPLDGSHVHRIASVSKQFTAMAVLLLADEGKISLEDDIREHIPGLREYERKITINAMLGHFSGMADYDFIAIGEGEEPSPGLNLKSVAGGEFRLGNEDYLTIDEFYQLVKTVPLRHAPNDKLTYSNLAYFLLAMLIEEVSGETLREYAAKRIFQPLKMHSSFFSDDPVEIVKNRASGYRPDAKGGFVTDMTNLFWVGDGGLHTTVSDLAKWDEYFYQPTLGKDPHKLLKLFNKPNSNYVAFGVGRYANGQLISEKYGQENFSHGGGWLGVSTYYSRYPESQFSSILFCNNSASPVDKYEEQIANLYFDSKNQN